MKSPRLASMSLEELKALTTRIAREIERRQMKERARIVRELDKLGAIDGIANAWRRQPRAKAKVKYRGPKRGEKWSGSGLTPRWMTAYIKQGKKKEQFLVK